MSDQIHYRLLSEGEIIQEGDEYYESTEWLKSDQVGGRIGRVSKPARRLSTPFQWIPVEERLPTREDAESDGTVACWFPEHGCSMPRHWDHYSVKDAVAWAKIPPYIPSVSPEEKEFEAWMDDYLHNGDKGNYKDIAKAAWMAAKKGGKA